LQPLDAASHPYFSDILRRMIRSYKGLTPTVPPSCYVDESAQLIGDVVLGEKASVWMNAVLRGDVHMIRVGAHSNIQDCSVLHGMLGKWPVVVGGNAARLRRGRSMPHRDGSDNPKWRAHWSGIDHSGRNVDTGRYRR
jgi:hypothetical protein